MQFLHRLDVLARRIMVVETNQSRLRSASFLDGRERFWDEHWVGEATQLAKTDRGAPAGWIFHMGFCGSTLLTRMLDGPGDVLCLREPQALVDLSDQQIAIRESGASDGAEFWLTGLATHFEGLVGPGGRVVVKPSNWANPLLGAMRQAGLLEHAVFVTMDRRAWLRACMRGGRDRLAFVARCAEHAVRNAPEFAPVLRKAITAGGEPLDQVVRLAAVLYEVQLAQFDSVDPTGSRRIDFELIETRPICAVQQARSLMGLPAGQDDVTARDWHSKDPSRRYDATIRVEEDRRVEAEHSARIDSAMAWIDRTLSARRRSALKMRKSA